MTELRRASSMADLTPGHKLAPLSQFSCAGIRSMQQMRRSRSTSRVAGRVQCKVRAAKEYVIKFGFETELSTMASAPLTKAKLLKVPVVESSANKPMMQVKKHCFAKYYKQHFNLDAMCSKQMDSLYQQFAKPAAVEESSFKETSSEASFTKYYKQNFSLGASTKSKLNDLYSLFAQPAAAKNEDKNGESSFKEYYQDNFITAPVLPKALYEQFSRPVAKEESFKEYYVKHFAAPATSSSTLYADFACTRPTEISEYYKSDFPLKASFDNLYKQFEKLDEAQQFFKLRSARVECAQASSLPVKTLASLYQLFDRKPEVEVSASAEKEATAVQPLSGVSIEESSEKVPCRRLLENRPSVGSWRLPLRSTKLRNARK